MHLAQNRIILLLYIFYFQLSNIYLKRKKKHKQELSAFTELDFKNHLKLGCGKPFAFIMSSHF